VEISARLALTFSVAASEAENSEIVDHLFATSCLLPFIASSIALTG
jgi:hypothetical protein